MFDELVTAWTAYTPGTDGTLTLGDGSWEGSAYAQTGKWVRFRIVLTFGETTAFTSDSLTLILPTPPVSIDFAPIGRAVLRDASNGQIENASTAVLSSAAGAICLPLGGFDFAGDAVPWAWAAGDTIVVAGDYETA